MKWHRFESPSDDTKPPTETSNTSTSDGHCGGAPKSPENERNTPKVWALRKIDILREAQTHAEKILTGEFETLINRFTLPLPVYMPAKFAIFSSRSELECALSRQRRSMLELGVTQLVPVDAEILDNSGNRALVTILWEHQDKFGNCVRQANASYVLANDCKGKMPKIEMINSTRMAYPNSLDTGVVAKFN